MLNKTNVKAENPESQVYQAFWDDFVETDAPLTEEFPDIHWSNWIPLGDNYQKNKYICYMLKLHHNR